MKNHECTQIVTIPGEFYELFNDKAITYKLKRLIEVGHNCCDKRNSLEEELIDALVGICETCDRVIPQNTVETLEMLLFFSKLTPNANFINQYVCCLACSCRDYTDDIDENYIQSVIDKLRIIIGIVENMDITVREDIDITDLIECYIKCLSRLSYEQEPIKAKETVLELKSIGDKTGAWDNFENIINYCCALEQLCCNQSRVDDIQGAYETLEILKDIINDNSDVDDITIFICYSYALQELCDNENISASETLKLTKRLEKIFKQTQSLEDSDIIASYYMQGLANLCIKQKNDEKTNSCKKTFERARIVAENARYKKDDDIIGWYVTIYIYKMDGSNLDEVRSAFELLTDIMKRPNFLDDEFISYHYNYMKQLLKNAGIEIL